MTLLRRWRIVLVTGKTELQPGTSSKQAVNIWLKNNPGKQRNMIARVETEEGQAVLSQNWS